MEILREQQKVSRDHEKKLQGLLEQVNSDAQHEGAELARSLRETLRMNQGVLQECTRLAQTIQELTGALTAAGAKLDSCVGQVKTLINQRGRSTESANIAAHMPSLESQAVCGYGRPTESHIFQKSTAPAAKENRAIIEEKLYAENDWFSEKSADWTEEPCTTVAAQKRSPLQFIRPIKASPACKPWENRKWCLGSGKDVVTISLSSEASTSDSEEEISPSHVTQKRPLQFLSRNRPPLQAKRTPCSTARQLTGSSLLVKRRCATAKHGTLTTPLQTASVSPVLSVFDWQPESASGMKDNKEVSNRKSSLIQLKSRDKSSAVSPTKQRNQSKVLTDYLDFV